MKTLERINIDANQFASHESAPNEMEKYNELYSGYIAGATAENERLQQQIKIANNKINDLQEQLKSSNDKVSELKSAQELNQEKEREIDKLYKKFIHLANSDGCPKKVSGEIYSILNDSVLNKAQ